VLEFARYITLIAKDDQRGQLHVQELLLLLPHYQTPLKVLRFEDATSPDDGPNPQNKEIIVSVSKAESWSALSVQKRRFSLHVTASLLLYYSVFSSNIFSFDSFTIQSVRIKTSTFHHSLVH
jgi:hypothetical protein